MAIAQWADRRLPRARTTSARPDAEPQRARRHGNAALVVLLAAPYVMACLCEGRSGSVGQGCTVEYVETVEHGKMITHSSTVPVAVRQASAASPGLRAGCRSTRFKILARLSERALLVRLQMV